MKIFILIESATVDAELDYSQTILKASKYDHDTHNTSQRHVSVDRQDGYNILGKFDLNSGHEVIEHPSSFLNNEIKSSPSRETLKPSINKANNSFSSEIKQQQTSITHNIDSIRETNRRQSSNSPASDSPLKTSINFFPAQNVSSDESRKSSAASIISNKVKVNNNKAAVDTANSPSKIISAKQNIKNKTTDSANSSIISNKQNNNNKPVDTVFNKNNQNSIIGNSITSNITNDGNRTLKDANETKTKAVRYLEDSDDDDRIKPAPKPLRTNGSSDLDDDESFKLKKTESKQVHHQESSNLDEEDKTDRDEVDKYFLSTLKAAPIHTKDDDDDDDDNEDTQSFSQTHSNISNSQNKKKAPLMNDDEIDFDYNFGPKEDDEEEENDEEINKLTQTINKDKRFQTTNFNQTLKFDIKSNDASFNEDMPKAAPRRIQKISESSNSDSF